MDPETPRFEATEPVEQVPDKIDEEDDVTETSDEPAASNDNKSEDGETVASDPSLEMMVSKGPSTRRRIRRVKKKTCVILIAVAVFLVAVALGVMVYFLTARSTVLREEAAAAGGAGGSSKEYQLTETYSPASAGFSYASDEWNEIGFINTETGCLDIMDKVSEEKTSLCKDFTNVREFALRGEDAVIARDGAVEVWKRDVMSSEWSAYPGGTGRSVVMKSSNLNFGKDIYSFGDFVFVAADDHVFLYKMYNGRGWVEKESWPSMGFAVSPDETTLAVYDQESIAVYDLGPHWFGKLETPTIYSSRKPIEKVVLSDDEIHVVSAVDDQSGFASILNLLSGHTTMLGFKSRVVGDAVLSLKTGCLVDVRANEYFSVTVDADDVTDVQITEGRLVVLVERDGAQMVDVYEKK